MSLALGDGMRSGFTEEQVGVIKATIAPGASNEELALFLMVCQKTGLDPFSRQIYLSERWSNGVSKKTPETTIDGFRVIAERSGKYAGQVGPYWCGDDGEWKDVWLSDTMPSAAKVGVLRSDFHEPLWGIALFLEYAQYKKARDGKPAELNSMWQKMAANQLAKCAEALALRKAFPRDLSGMYSREEMAQAELPEPRGTRDAQKEVANRKIHELQAGSTITAADLAATEPELQSSPFLADLQRKTDHEMIQALTYEQRHAAKVAEANEAIKPEPKPARKRGTVSFEGLKLIKERKDGIRKLTGSDELYYDALKLAGVSHADELDSEDARKVAKALAGIERTKRQEAELADKFAEYTEQLGVEAFVAILGANGCVNVTEAMQLGGTPLSALLADLKQAAADRVTA